MNSRSLTLTEDKEIERNVTSSPRRSFDKKTKPQQDDTPTETDKDEEGSFRDVATGDLPEEEDGGDYPSGIHMAFIVVALVLSIFLVSYPSPTFPIHLIFQGIPRHDNRSNRNPENYRRIPRARPHRLVRLSLLPNPRLFPIHLGQGTQVLSSQDNILNRNFHFRAWQSYLW
jgi:hypothetical protein